MARPPNTQPTEGELEILNILWESGPADLGTIRAALQGRRAVATTTIATMLKLMREKGLVERSDGPRGYIWGAKVSLNAARSGLLGKLLNLVFDGSPRRLVAHLLEEDALSDRDREAIRRIIEARKPEGPSRGGEKTP